MSSGSKVGSLKRSLTALFGNNKTVIARKLYPDEYHKHFYLSKPLYEGIELALK